MKTADENYLFSWNNNATTTMKLIQTLTYILLLNKKYASYFHYRGIKNLYYRNGLQYPLFILLILFNSAIQRNFTV